MHRSGAFEAHDAVPALFSHKPSRLAACKTLANISEPCSQPSEDSPPAQAILDHTKASARALSCGSAASPALQRLQVK